MSAFSTRRRFIVLSALALAGTVSAGLWLRRSSVTRWTMINVCPKEAQADCHLLSLPDGTHALIDAADAADAPGTALAYLQKHRIKRLALVVLTHFHKDHYGRLADMIRAGIVVDRVAINLTGSREIADRERPWGCDWEDVQALLAFLRERRIPYFTPVAGERLIECHCAGILTSLDVIALFDGYNTPFGKTDINDTSIILRLAHGPTRVLFTGDLNARMSDYLVKENYDVAAELLKAPHHGAAGHASNEFFDRVGAKAAFVPTPRVLWTTPRCQRAREYFESHRTPTYVSGRDGHVTVTLGPRGYTIDTDVD